MDAKRKPSVAPTADGAPAKGAPKTLSWFTLVELIVVITILAILATIGFLALSGYTQDAKDASVKANVRSVMTAISSESAITNNSPRYYVVHDSGAALTGGTVAYVDNSPVVLTGGDWNVSGTNYSAGNPDWAKLKLNPEKFRTSSRPPMGGFLSLASLLPDSFAAYDSKSLSVGAVDAALSPAANGRARSTSFFQVAGTAPATGSVSVSGNFPQPTAAQVSAGAAAGLVKAPTGTGALVDGSSSGTSGSSSSSSSSGGPANSCAANPSFANLGTLTTGSPASAGQAWTYSATPGNCTYSCLNGYSGTNCATASQYPNCDAPDIYLTGSNQYWAACNAGPGSLTAYSSQSVTLADATATGGPTASQKAYMGAFYQWGRNADVTTGTTVAGPLAAATAASETRFITNGTAPRDWLSVQDDNLWGGTGSTTSAGTYSSLWSPAAMQGPCATGYHVPTQKEWCDAIVAVSPTQNGGAAMVCDANWHVEATANKFMSTLKLPLAGFRLVSTAAFSYQGTFGYYWAASTTGTYGYTVYLSTTNGVLPANYTYRAHGFSVRCLKN